MTKAEALSTPTSCLNKAGFDEPVFVLRAKDPLAPAVVEVWASMAEAAEMHEAEKISMARTEADEMREWRRRNYAAPMPPEK